MTGFEGTFFASPKDAIRGGANELTQVHRELRELSKTFLRLGMAPIAEELDNHATAIARALELIRRACSHVQNN